MITTQNKKPYFIKELWHVHAKQHTAVHVHITPLTYEVTITVAALTW